MNILELIKNILVFALKVLYAIATMIDVSFLGWEIFPGFKLYYVLGAILAYYIGKKWLVKILMSPVTTLTFLGNLILEVLRAIFLKFIPSVWRFILSLFKTSSTKTQSYWWEDFKDRIEDFWWNIRY